MPSADVEALTAQLREKDAEIAELNAEKVDFELAMSLGLGIGLLGT